MVEIYRKSLRYYWQTLPALLFMAALLDGGLLLLHPKHELAVTLVPILLIA